MAASIDEEFISVDVEAAGPNPSQYSMLSIGACVVREPTTTFYVELRPVHDAATAEAMRVGGFDLDELRERGLPPEEAMGRFAAWLTEITPPDRRPVFVGFNAAFDWMFVADYFHRFLGENPFGHKALDIKALYMGRNHTAWAETRFRDLAKHYRMEQGSLTHNALEDALVQAALFRRVLDEE